MLYGVSLIYGAAGSLDFLTICRNIHLFYAAGLAGVVLIMAGFFFKLSAIPFHMWAPDVYQGAPTPITALLAMSSKAAGLAVFMRVLYVAFPILGTYWMTLLAAFAALSMIGGNIMAMKQKDVKRMLAYSSIAQAFAVGTARSPRCAVRSMSPFFFNASRCAPRAINVTSLPASARYAPTMPPTPPAPRTANFIAFPPASFNTTFPASRPQS